MVAETLHNQKFIERVRKVAARRGVTFEEVVVELIEPALKDVESHGGTELADDAANARRWLDEFIARTSRAFPEDASLDEIMNDMYDENGLPR